MDYTGLVELERRGKLCGALGLIPLPHTKVAAVLCGAMMHDGGTAAQTRDPTAPNLFVVLKTGSEAVYRTSTALKTYSVDFDAKFAVPLNAIPPTGIELLVKNDTGDGTDGEDIAVFRLFEREGHQRGGLTRPSRRARRRQRWRLEAGVVRQSS